MTSDVKPKAEQLAVVPLSENVAAVVTKEPVVPAVVRGTRLQASDRVYVVDHAQYTRVDKDHASLVALTLRRAIPKVRGKAARKADKRARRAARAGQ